MSRTIHHNLTPEEVDALTKIAERFARAQGENETLETVFGKGSLVASQTKGSYYIAVVVDDPEPE